MTEALLRASENNPVPENHTVGYFTGYGGKQLRYAIFRATRQLARGTVVLLHGRNECIEKYFETINDLTAMGFWVATFDTRGQGGSERLRKNDAGHVRRFADYQRDINLFLEQIVLPDTRLPFFMVAHSTGALSALASAPRLSNRIERLVLSSPFVALGEQQSVPPSIIRLVSTVFSLVGLGGVQLGKDQRERDFDGNPLTSDAARFARNLALHKEHGDLFVGAPTARWLYEALKTMRRVNRQEHLTNVMIPTLVLAPMLDTITPYKAQEELSRNFRAAQLLPITGARHELLHERDIYRRQALAAIDAFFAPE